MATLSEINDRVRLELGDQAQAFVQTFTGDGTSTVWNLNLYPVDAATLVVKVNGTPVSAAVEERTGRVVTTAAPALNAVVTISGNHFRYFSNTDLSTITASAMDIHLNNRTDQYGRAITLANLPAIEMYPAALMASIQALWALATDASFDIDISTPDGVTIPRSERFRQLMAMIEARTEQYKELSTALGIGLYRIEVFTFRRISKGTGRYVPVYVPKEIDDYGKPERVYLPIPTYGSTPVPVATGVYDITLTQGDGYSVTLDFDFDVTNYTVKAQSRTIPESPILACEFTVVVIDGPNGIVRLDLTADQTRLLPLKSFWDVQVTNNSNAADVQTLLQGVLIAERDITR